MAKHLDAKDYLPPVKNCFKFDNDNDDFEQLVRIQGLETNTTVIASSSSEAYGYAAACIVNFSIVSVSSLKWDKYTKYCISWYTLPTD